VVSVSTQNQGLGSLVNLDHPELDCCIEIQTTTIDEFMHEKGIDHVDIMKVDIQGGEILLLKGGTRFFSSNEAPDLLMEVSPSDLRSLGLSSKDELRLLEDYGYAIYEVTSRGQIGRQIFADSIASDFAASNVFCSKR